MIEGRVGGAPSGPTSFQQPISAASTSSRGSTPRIYLIKYERKPTAGPPDARSSPRKPFSHTGNGYSHDRTTTTTPPPPPESGRQSALSDAQRSSAAPELFSSAYSQYGDPLDDSLLATPPFSPNDYRERLSPVQQFMTYRSPSPDVSMISSGSKKTKDSVTITDTEATSSSGAFEPRYHVDFSRFYRSSFLNLPSNPKDFRRSPVDRHKENKAPAKNWHRPDNFSYRQVRRDNKPTRTSFIGKTMLSALGDRKFNQKQLELLETMDKREAINLSKFPNGHQPEKEYSSPIERDDWPAPPEPAAAFPELLREHPLGAGRAKSMDEIEAEEQDEEVQIDEKTKWKIKELEKIKSGLGDAFMADFKLTRHHGPALDPRSASRTPAADHEPSFKTRYESPIFASPSRDLEGRPILYSLDDQIIGRKYRNSTLPLSNFPIPKPGYGLRRRNYHDGYVSEPDYARGYMSEPDYRMGRVDSSQERFMDTTPTKDSGPANGARDERENGRIDEKRHGGENGRIDEKRDGGEDGRGDGRGDSREVGRRARPAVSSSQDRLERRSIHTSQSSMEEYDPETGLRRCRYRSSGTSDNISSLLHYGKIGRSISGVLRTDEPAQVYPYEELCITNENLPAGVDRNFTEVHLSKQEFEKIFKMSREEFSRLAEWKRNDMKKKINLF